MINANKPYKKLLSLILVASAFGLGSMSAHADSILGTWGGVDSSNVFALTFLPNGKYVHVQYGATNVDGQSGIEVGTYTWNSSSGAFTDQVILDTNGGWGLSVPPSGTSCLSTSGCTLAASNGTLTGVTPPDPPFSLTSVTGWYSLNNPNPGDVTVFDKFANGTYLIAIDRAGIGDYIFGTWNNSGNLTKIAGSNPLINFTSFSIVGSQLNLSGASGIIAVTPTPTATPTPIPPLPGAPIPATHGDFNGDGKADILWRGPVGEVGVWTMSGSTLLTSAVVSTVPSNWTIAGVGDFNGDGKADILWRGPNGEVAIWTMNGSAMLTGTVVSTVPPSWTIAGVGDFDGDGKADILWRGPNGEVALWYMSGGTMMSNALVGTAPTTWTIVGTGDYIGDGKADILWRANDGTNTVWYLTAATIINPATINVVPDLNWKVQNFR